MLPDALTYDRAMHNDLCMPDEPLIGSAEACELLGIDRSTLTRWVAQDKILAAQKMPGQSGAFLFERSEVLRRKAVVAAERESVGAAAPASSP
jgi:excisionase family DNA binding protein